MVDASSLPADGFDQYVFTPRSYTRGLATYLQGWNRDGTRKPFARINTFGPPGVGKTEMHAQLAKRWLRRLVTLHLSQKNPHDLQGIPVVLPDGSIQWFVTSYFPQQQTHRGAVGNNTFYTNFKYAEHVIVRIVDEQTGEEVGVFGDGQRYDLGLEDLNLIGAVVKVEKPSGESAVVVDLSKAPKGSTYTVYIEDACMMFLDDLTAAPKSVLKAALQLINDYRVGEYDVPFSCPLMGASNHEGHASYIETLSAAVANRLIHIHLKADIEDSIEHWTNINAHPLLISFFVYQSTEATGPEMLHFFNKASMKLGQLGWRSPRAWERMAEQLQACMDEDEFIKNEAGYNPARDMLIRDAMIVGTVGEQGGRSFITYLATAADMPNPEDILTGKVKKIEAKYAKDTAFQSGLAVSLAGAIKKFHTRYYKEGVEFAKQDPIWQAAVKNLFAFTKTEFKREVVAMFSHFVVNSYQMSLVIFRAVPPIPEVDEWAKSAIPLMRRVQRSKVA